MKRTGDARDRQAVQAPGWPGRARLGRRDVAFVLGGVCIAVALAWMYEVGVRAADAAERERFLPAGGLRQAVPAMRGSPVRPGFRWKRS